MARRKRFKGKQKRRNLRTEILEHRRLLAGPQEIEPNDAQGQANALVAEESTIVPGLIRNRISGDITAGESDFFSLTAFAGDLVSVGLSANGSELDSRLKFRNGAGSVLAPVLSVGPGQDNLTPTIAIETSGTYFVEVAGDNASTTGGYQLDAVVARGLEFESDPFTRSNDSVSFAEPVGLTVRGNELIGRMGGSIRSPIGTNEDEDYFRIGALNPGVNVSVDLTRPEWSGLDAQVDVIDYAGTLVTDSDPSATAFDGTIEADGEYFLRVVALSNAGPSDPYVLDIRIEDTVAPVVSSVSRLASSPDESNEIIATFSTQLSEPLRQESLASAAFDLREAGNDGDFETADDVVYATSFDYVGSANRIDFVVTDGPLGDGEYRLTLPSSITDLVGNSLEGGSGFVRNFTVDAVPDEGVFEGRNNRTYTKATPLALEVDVNGTGWLRSEVGYGSIDPLNDEDWWSFAGLAGDRVDVWAQEQIGGDQPYVNLYRLNDGGTNVTSLASGYRSGPNDTAYISGWELPVDGTYYVRVQRFGGGAGGGYDLRVNLNRTVDVETDAGFSNDDSSDSLTFTAQGNSRVAAIAGTVMSIDDEDRYALGFLNAGNTVTVDAGSLPQWSTLEPEVRVFRVDPSNSSNLLFVTDDDEADDVFTATLDADGSYFAEVRTRTAVRDGSRFTLSDDYISWTDAEAYAVSQGGQLVSIDSAEEQAFLRNTFGTGFWTGLNDAAEEGTFVWSDGTALSYEAWYQGSAAGARNSSSRDYVYFHHDELGSWYLAWKDENRRSLIVQPMGVGDPVASGPGLDAQYVLDISVADLVPPRATSLSRLPDEGGSTEELLSTFSVDFSEALDEATLQENVFDLRAAGDDGAFDTADDIVYGLTSTYDASRFRLNFTVTDGPLVDGSHRFTITDSVTDALGNRLDGNTDGIAGGNFVRTFTVDAVPDGGVFEGRDNGEYPKATPLALQVDVNGTGWLRSELGYGSVDPANDQDWWSFAGLAGDSVDVWAQEQAGGDWAYIHLYRRHDNGTSVTSLASGYRSGPNDTAYISGLELPVDGTYYVRVNRLSGSGGGYDLRVNLNRTADVETDAGFANDTTSDSLMFTAQGNSRVASIAGTVMSIDDEDRYKLGFLNGGNTVTVDAGSLPQWSTLEPEVRVFRVDPANSSNLLFVADDDGADDVFTATLDADGTYFAEVRTRTAVRDGSRFTLTDESTTWTDAEAYAVSQGGQLVSIDSADEQAFLRDTFGAGFWTGLNDAAEEGTFVWSDGTAFSSEAWYQGSASGAQNNGSRDYVYFRNDEIGSWYLGSNGENRRSLIEQPTGAGDPIASGPGLDAQYVLNISVADLVPPLVTSVSRLPDEGGSTEEALGTFDVEFSEALDEATLQENAFDLRAAGDDGAFDTADDIVYILAPTYSANSFSIDFLLTDGPLVDGTHRFTITDSVTDALGNRLDGDTDDVAGGDFVRTFTVDAVPDDGVFEGRDNGDYTKATPLALEVDVNGTGWLRSEVGYGSIDPRTDDDWWSFEGLAGDNVDVWAQEQVGGDRPYISLYRLHDSGMSVTRLAGDSRSGPDNSAYISGIELPVDGTYFVRVDRSGFDGSGGYDVRVNLNRTADVETDAGFSNDNISDSLTFTKEGNSRVAAVAGTVMSIDDEDRYALGFLNAGNTVTVDAASLPQWSILEPEVRVFRVDPANSSNLLFVPDDNAADDVFTATLDADGAYFAEVRTRTAVRDGSRFTLTDESTSWTDAEAYAVSQRGQLASIDSADEQAFLRNAFGTGFWIGLNDAAEEGTFVWSDGTALSYEAWYQDSPSGAQNNSSRDYVYFRNDELGSWHLGSNGENRRSLIVQPTGAGDPVASGPGLDAQYVLNVSVSDLVPPLVTSVSRLPAEDGSTEEILGTFAVDFSEPLDEATLQENAFDLRAAGDDGVFDTADDMVYGLTSTYDANSFRLSFTVTDGPLVDGSHRFTITDSVTDALGNRLDGNSDAAAGGNFVRTFTVDAVSDEGVFEGRDNGEYTKATPLALEVDVNGTGWLRSEVGYGSIDPANDQDWWSFTGLAGDSVDVWAQEPAGGDRPYINLYRLNDGATNVTSLASGYRSGPNDTAYISGIELPVDGTYYVRVARFSGGGGGYDLRVNLSGSSDIETDANFGNDRSTSANPIAFDLSSDSRTGSRLGTIMSSQSGNVDADYYSLGEVALGETILARVQLPHWSSLQPLIEIRNSTGNVVSVNPVPSGSEVARFTATESGNFYAVVLGLSGEGILGQYRLDTVISDELNVADLAVSEINLPADVPTAGDDITVSWSVGNFGTAATDISTWTDRVILSSNATLGDFDDTVLGNFVRTGKLAPGQSYAAEVTAAISERLSGDFTVFVQTDFRNDLFEFILDDNNSLQASSALTINPPPLPDLVIDPATMEVPSTIDPDLPFAITWTTSNSGAVSVEQNWEERVYLSDSATGQNRQLLGTFIRGEVLPSGTVGTPRTETLRLPAGSFAGDVFFVFEIDADDSVFESSEANRFVSNQSASIPFELSISGLSEKLVEGASSRRFSITRNGPTEQPLVVSLVADVASQVTFPNEVIIPAGRSSTSFLAQARDDGLVDGDQTVTLTASVAGFDSATRSISVVDSDVPSLDVDLLADPFDEGQTGTLTVGYNGITETDLAVELVQMPRGEIDLPRVVTIPAGRSTLEIPFTVLDDDQFEGIEFVELKARASGYASDSQELTVETSDVPTIELSIPARLAEGSQSFGTISLSQTRNAPTPIVLAASNTGDLFTLPTVTIPAGSRTVQFSLIAIDNGLVDGERELSLSATPTPDFDSPVIASAQVFKSIAIVDNDGPSLTATLDLAIIGENGASTLTVSRNTDTASALTVNLESDDTSEATVPATATIPAGASSVKVTVTAVQDDVVDGDQHVNITAVANGFNSGLAALVVSDLDLPDLVVSSIVAPAELSPGAQPTIQWSVANQGIAPTAIGWTERLYLSSDARMGDDTLLGEYRFSGPLLEGATNERRIPVVFPETPGQFWFIVEVDSENVIREGLEANNDLVSSIPIQIRAPYSATVETEIESAATGTTVPLSGTATNQDGSPAALVDVAVTISVRGTDRVLTTRTDVHGNFNLEFTPLPNEGGRYTVAASHPTVPAGASQDEFLLLGLAPTAGFDFISLPAGTTTTQNITIQNLANVPLSGLTVEAIGVPDDLSVNPSIASMELASSASFPLNYDLTDANAALGESSFTLRITSTEAPALEIPITVEVIPPSAVLVTDMPNVESTMVVGEQSSVEVILENHGGAESGPVRLLLPADTPWLSVTSGRTVESVAPGDSTTLTILLTPSANLELGEYKGSIIASTADSDLAINFKFRAVAETTGDLRVTVVDELFYFAEDSPTVTDAIVELRDPRTRQVVATNQGAGTGGAEGEDVGNVVVNADGSVIFADVPRGKYVVTVRSDQHDSNEALLTIPAGETAEERIFVSRNFVEYTWAVEEVAVEDRTRVTVEANFQTNVPAPVVVVESNIDLFDLRLPGQSRTFDVNYTNEGFIQAEDIELFFEDHPLYEIEPLVDSIPVLPARSTATIPVRIRRRAAPAGIAEGESSPNSGANCSIAAYTVYRYVCGPNGVWKRVPIPVAGVDGVCPPGGGGHVGGGGGVAAGSGGLTGGSSGFGGIFGGGGRAGGRQGIPPDVTAPSPVIPAAPSSCDACIEEVGKQARKYLTGKLPFAGEVGLAMNWGDAIQDGTGALVGDGPNSAAEANDALKNAGKTALGLLSLVPSPIAPIARGALIAWDAFDVAYPILTKCAGLLGIGPSAPAGMAEGEGPAGAGPQVREAATRLQQLLDYYEAISAPEAYLYGSESFIGVSQSPEKISWVEDVKSLIIRADGGFATITAAEHQSLLAHVHRPDAVSDEDIDRFVERLNRSIDYWDQGFFTAEDLPAGADADFIALDRWVELMQRAQDAYVSFGTRSLPALDSEVTATVTDLLNALNAHSDDGVCAEVRLQISQDVIQTRQGFQATLGIMNQTFDSLNNVSADIVVRDESGDDVSELFGITLVNLAGLLDLGGDSDLSAGTEGVASWLVVPSSEAAPEGPTEYYLAGNLRYESLGQSVEETLLPTPITVLPQPELSLDYFLQRDVIGDDPHTEAIEPSEVFTLGVQIRNEGVGEAHELRIESAQPKIVENEKGLLIDFEIVGTSVNGEPAERTLTALIGDLPGGELAIAEWQLESTLQGLFAEYEASFEHISDFGRPDLSLVKNVQIHELIRPVQATASGVDDSLTDFLVNDVPDPKDLPDTLYLSDGSIAEVDLGTKAVAGSIPSPSDLVVDVAADMPAGWAYLQLNDPSEGNYQLNGVRRSDGTMLDATDFWQTDRTFIGLGLRPLYENKVHLLDFDSTGSYELIFSNGDLEGPTVDRFSGVNPNPTGRTIGVIDVHFSELVDPATIGADDIALLKNGAEVDNASISVSTATNPTIRISGLGGLTADDAVYELRIQLASVTDVVGNPGDDVASLTWVKGEAAPAVIEVAGLPDGVTSNGPESFSVQTTEPVDLDSLRNAITLTRDGQTVDLAPASINQIESSRYEISGIGNLASTDGTYLLSIDASQLVDLDGLTGFGQTTRSWTLDTAAAEIRQVFSPPTNPRNTVVQRIDVQFSEPIDLETFSVDDIMLTRENGTENLIAGDSRVTFEHRGNNVYRIGGINWVQGFIADPQIADFTFTIIGDGITDVAGNPATGSSSTTWTIDLVSPTEPSGLQLAVAELPAGADENAPNAVFSGLVVEDGLTLVVVNDYTDEEIYRAGLADRAFSIPLRLPAEGRNELSGRLIDAAGNTTDFDLPVAVTTSLPPVIVATTDFSPRLRRTLIEQFTVSFAEPVETGSFSLAAIQLQRDGQVVSLPGSASIVPSADGRTFTIQGLAEATHDEGRYRLSIDLSQIRGSDGTVGIGSYTESWTLDKTPPATQVVSTLLDSSGRRYLVGVSSSDEGAASTGVSGLQVYTASAGSPLRFVEVLEPAMPAIEFESGADEEHLFFANATDFAGNERSLMVDAADTFPIRVDANLLVGLPNDLIVSKGTELDFVGDWTVETPEVDSGFLRHRLRMGNRVLSVETSTPWQNPLLAADVNRDGEVSPLDALRIINRLNRFGRGSDFVLPPPVNGASHEYYDVTGDGKAIPLDALRVINYLNRQQFGSVANGEGESSGLNQLAPPISPDPTSLFARAEYDPSAKREEKTFSDARRPIPAIGQPLEPEWNVAAQTAAVDSVFTEVGSHEDSDEEATVSISELT